MPPSSYYLPGDRIDSRYKVIDIKRGAMGIVYLCIDAKTALPIALKTFQDHLLKTEASRQQFFEEALLWIELGKHPCIVQAYGLRLIEEKPYLLVERIESKNPRGVTLKDHIYTHTLKLDFVMQSAINLCDAMMHADERFPGFVHGDLKPENILLGDDLIPKLTDFGIATHMQAIESNTSTLSPYELATRMVGTPAFSSPEQCRLKGLDVRSDIYSFGCILYQMVTKQAPFAYAEVAEYIHAHLNHTPKPPNELQFDVPDEISNVIMKCLRKSPYERYQSFDELKEDLLHIHIRIFGRHVKTYEAVNELSMEEMIERGWSFALVGQYDKADHEFACAHTQYEEDPDLYEQLARYQYAKHDYEKAFRYLEKALEANPNDNDLLELQGLIYIEQHQWKAAEFVLKQVITNEPARIRSYLLLSKVYQERNKEQQRETILKNAIELCEYDPSLVNELLGLWLKKNNFSQIKTLANKTLEIHANHPDILLRLAQAYAATRDNRRAQECLQHASESSPESFLFWHSTGQVYFRMREYTQAYDAYNNALLYDDGDGDFYANMAEMSMHLSRYDEAWRLAEKAESLGANTNTLKDNIKRKRFNV